MSSAPLENGTTLVFEPLLALATSLNVVELITIMETACQLLSSGQLAYQRDVYYRNAAVLKSTENVRALCNEIAFHFGVLPVELNIASISCPKGLIHGHATVELNDGSKLDCSIFGGLSMPHTRFVTVFFALTQCGFLERFPMALLVTGKGYPDVNTREILAMLPCWMQICVLVDSDPDGAHIFQVYSEGGWRKTLPWLLNARWAGLHCSATHIGSWGLDLDKTQEFSARDRRLALKLAKRWRAVPDRRRRMAKMLYLGKKAELELVTQHRTVLLDYISDIVQPWHM
ncbi:DNA topoisomerase IV, alpha subunit [Martensiomyces pterosporus]|nr:DNA topoisomerase IV, alpha subunit [Martensiomyces pterosporus]